MGAYDDSSDPQTKKLCNIDFVTSVHSTMLQKSNEQQQKAKIIVLDGPNMFTSKWFKRLSGQVINHNNIIVPNCNIEDVKIMEKINGKNPFASVKHAYLNSVLCRSILENNCYAMWMDYTCQWNGNIFIKPQDDVKNVFNNKLLQDQSVFAITVNTRNSGHVTAHKINQFVEYLAAKNGYLLIGSPIAIIYDQMVYIRWFIFKLKSPLLNKVSILLSDAAQRKYNAMDKESLYPDQVSNSSSVSKKRKFSSITNNENTYYLRNRKLLRVLRNRQIIGAKE